MITPGRPCRGYPVIFWCVLPTPRNGVGLGPVRLAAVRFRLGPGSNGLPVAVELPIRAVALSSREKYPGQKLLRLAGRRYWDRWSDRGGGLEQPPYPHQPPQNKRVRHGPATDARPATTTGRPTKYIRLLWQRLPPTAPPGR